MVFTQHDRSSWFLFAGERHTTRPRWPVSSRPDVGSSCTQCTEGKDEELRRRHVSIFGTWTMFNLAEKQTAEINIMELPVRSCEPLMFPVSR